MLSDAQLAAIFQTKEDRRSKQGAGKGKAFIRSADGQLDTQTIKKMGDFDLGTMVGKVGSMRRSSKGRTYRMPNGSRRYQPYDYDNGAQAVVAYSLNKR